MSERRATCSCGQLQVCVEGDPVRVSICHCLACQRRTGSVFGTQARFHRDQVVRIEGVSSPYLRTGDTGKTVTLHFCPHCGTTVYWELETLEDFLAVAVGCFGDPGFGEPKVSVYETRRHAWTQGANPAAMEHWD